MRFSPFIARTIVGVWLMSVLAVYFFVYEKAWIVPYLLKLAGHALPLLSGPAGFWRVAGDRLLGCVAVLLLFGSAWCIGLALLRCLRWARCVDALASLFAVGFGLGIWSSFILVAGLLGWMQPGLYLGTAVGSLLLLGWHRPWLREAWKQSRATRSVRLSGYERCLLVALGASGVLVLIPSLTPEVEYDALGYHLASLADYRKAGRIEFLPYNSLASLPSLTEMLYLWGITVRDSSAAKLIHGMFGVLLATGLVAFGTRLQSRSVGLTAAALFYLLPNVTVLSETARVDLATAFYGFLAGMALHQYLYDVAGTRQNSAVPVSGDTSLLPTSSTWLWLAALATGFSMATKYTAAPVVLVPCLILLTMHLRGRTLGLRFLGFLFLSTLPILPWLLKNCAFTGNPVFPLAQELFADETRRAAPFAGPSFDSAGDWTSLVTGFWNFSVKDPYASPSLLLFAPLLLMLSRNGTSCKFCAWFGGLGYLFWFLLTGRQWRWFCPILPWLALLGAFAIAACERDRVMAVLSRGALALILAFNLGLSFLVSAFDHSGRFPPVMTKLSVFLGHVSEMDYVDDLFGAIGWMNTHLPEDATVLYVGETRTFYARHRVLSSQPYDRNLLADLLEGAGKPDTVLDRMVQRGVTHIYVDLFEVNQQNRAVGNFQEVNWDLFESFLRSHSRQIFQHGTHGVYEIARPSA
jgi:hypothetical protein